jgi:hypothetical protein
LGATRRFAVTTIESEIISIVCVGLLPFMLRFLPI